MASMREIRSRMKSIQDTMKITNAMYLVSSSKLKKAKRSLAATEPYFNELQSTLHDIVVHTENLDHAYFDQRAKIEPQDRKIGYIVVSADKGLAGAYNHNIFKLAEEKMEREGNITVFNIGIVGSRYFEKKEGITVNDKFTYYGSSPKMYKVRDIADQVIEMYNNQELDEVYIIYTKMISSLKEEPEVIQLLPLQKSDFAEVRSEEGYVQFVDFYPSANDVLDHMVPNYVKGLIYGALVEAYSSEQNARLMAMESATDNAKDMLSSLSLMYNRARQAAITQEITEVVSGAKAKKKK